MYSWCWLLAAFTMDHSQLDMEEMEKATLNLSSHGATFGFVIAADLKMLTCILYSTVFHIMQAWWFEGFGFGDHNVLYYDTTP